MKSIKRRLADLLEAFSGNLIVPKDEVWRMPEWLNLRRFFRRFEVDCVFDVGANHGQYAKMLRQKVSFRGQIISFEPIPDLVEELRKASSTDSFWHIADFALGREAGVAPFNVMADSEFSSFLRPHRDQPVIFQHKNAIERTILIRRSTLKLEFQKYQSTYGFKQPFLKLDTQGADLMVIEGAADTIKEFVGIQMELAVRQLYDESEGMATAIAKLAELGFEPSAFVPNNDGHFPGLIEIDCIFFRRDAPLRPR